MAGYDECFGDCARGARAYCLRKALLFAHHGRALQGERKGNYSPADNNTGIRGRISVNRTEKI